MGRRKGERKADRGTNKVRVEVINLGQALISWKDEDLALILK